MKIFVAICAAVAVVTADLRPIEDPIRSRPFFGVPALELPPQGRITGGEEAGPNSIPYQVGLKIDVGGKTAFCGGSLLSANDVVTAAHCCEVALSIDVYLGSHNITAENEEHRQVIHVPEENIKVHEKWNQATLSNDICLLKLPKSAVLNEYVGVISIATDNDEKYEDRKVRESGWGRESDKSNTISPVLRFVESKVIKNSKCNMKYFGMIKDTHICADGSGGKSTCNGDSGGPLATVDDGRWTLIGITSFGISFGCEIGWPPAFTRVTSYADWILANMS